jgi:hypothetical protein
MKLNPIIFIGSGRSGTTLVSGALFSHKELGYPSNYQENFPKSLSVNLISRIFDNRFWRIYTRGKNFKLYKKLYFLPSESYSMWKFLTLPRINFSRSFLLDEKATESEKVFIRNYFEKMIKLQGKKRLAFKITGPSRIGYLLSIFPDARFIYVKRRMVPTVSSFMKTVFWVSRGKHKLWFEGAYSNDDLEYIKTLINHPAELTAFQIGRLYGVTHKEMKAMKPNVLELDYDDFLDNPKKNIKEILEFSDLDHSEACFNYIKYNGIKNNIKDDLDYYDEKTLKLLYNAYEKGFEF